MFLKIYRKCACAFAAAAVLIMSTVLTMQYAFPNKYYADGSESLCFSSSYGKLVTFDRKGASAEVLNQNRTAYFAKLKLLGIIPIKDVYVEIVSDKTVTVCGTPFGIKMFTDGVLVVGLSRISLKSGFSCPAVDSGICEGDIICAINGEKVYTNEDVALSIQNSSGNPLSILIKRGDEESVVSVTPALSSDGSGYKIGAWVRDSSAGIGTMTFYDSGSMSFAGLGHAVCDVDTGEILSVLSGEIVPATINSVKKGTSGAPGELCGSFMSTDAIGTIKTNLETGIYGTLSTEIYGTDYPVAHKQDVYEGAAVILSTVNGNKPAEYDIEIEKITFSDNALTKNMVIRVTDEDLLEQTGGIVQGMSGSPIIQNGKLIGAVTHVLISDPTRGYGIPVDHMLTMVK